MKPIRNEHTNAIFKLPGGTEENDLPIEHAVAELDGFPVMISNWELSDEERRWIILGGTVRLVVWGSVHPPVALSIELKGEILGVTRGPLDYTDGGPDEHFRESEKNYMAAAEESRDRGDHEE